MSALFFVLYFRRLCPTLSLNGDSAELVTAGAVWGIPHAPGYPLFTAIAHAFAFLPTHEVAWRIHLTSALFHGGAVGATCLGTFAVTRNHVAALASGIALGLERSFFLGSLYAEVFPLNDLFFATLLFLAIRLRSRTSDPSCAKPSPVAFVAVAGLAASHHMMIALAAPALAILSVGSLRAHCLGDPGTHSVTRFRRGLILVAAFLTPLVLSYALIPVAASRTPALSWGDVHDARSFLSLLTRSDYGGLLSSVHGAGHGTGPERLLALGDFLANGFGPFALLFALAGAVDLLRNQTTVGVSLLAAAVVTGPFFAWLNALGTSSEETIAFFERFTTMCSVPVAIAFGAGIGAAARWSSSLSARIAGSVALVSWITLSLLRVNGLDLSQDRRGIAFAHDLLLRSPDRSLILLSGDAAGGSALYVCVVERLCGERVPLSPGGLFMPWAMAQARRRHPDIVIPWSSGPGLKRTHELVAANAATRAVFVYPDLLEKDPLLTATFAPFPDHLLFRLWARDTDREMEREAFATSARAMAGAAPEDAATCEGCNLSSPQDHPTQEMQLVHAYAAASFNHAQSAAGFPETRDLVPLLLARSGSFAGEMENRPTSRERSDTLP